MFCPECGNKIDIGADFCSNCGNKIKNQEISNQLQQQLIQPKTDNFINETFSEKMARKNPLKPFFQNAIQKIKTMVIRYKRECVIGVSFVVLAMIGFILFNTFYDFTKIEWQKDGTDYNVEYTSASILNLEVIAFDREKNEITDIKYEVSDGTFESDETKVSWLLPKEEGEYTITATAPSGKSIQKEVTLVFIEDKRNIELPSMILDPNYDPETHDSNGNGISDAESIELGLNPFVLDTSGNGLPDTYMIEKGYDPLKYSQSGDGMSDGDKLALGLDPLKKDSFDDGIKDVDRVFTYEVKNDNDNVIVEITGSGNIATTTVDIYENSTIAKINGLINQVYDFNTSGNLQKSIVKIVYDKNEIDELGLEENNLILYYFDDETKQLTPNPTTVDIENSTITAELNHFSKYVIGDSELVRESIETQILFILDNSLSMYTQKQIDDAGFDIDCSDGCDNDPTFKRITLSIGLVDMLKGNYKFGVAQFSGSYHQMLEFNENKETVKSSLNKIKNDFSKTGDGTNIISSLNSGIFKFRNAEEKLNYIIFMTDGRDNRGGLLSISKNSIISSAKKNNVAICVIGLGDVDSKNLAEIANETGCGYYHAANAGLLNDIYAKIGARINYNYVDTVDDGEVDGMIIYDSGFVTARDGFSFRNYGNNQSPGGHCYGMASFAKWNYIKQLPHTLDDVNETGLFFRGAGWFKMEAPGYKLNNTHFFRSFRNTNNNLYDYSFSNDILNLFLGKTPPDYRDRIEDGIWYINPKYYDMLEKVGVTFSLKNYNGTISEIKQFQSAQLNIDDEEFVKSIDSDEYQLLRAIYRLFVLQINDKRTSFSSNPDKSFELLKYRLHSGIPTVISVGGNHAVNALRLISDIDDSNKFKIEVYDNNYPGQIRYIEVNRNKFTGFNFSYTAWTNEYQYKFKYNNKDTTVTVHVPSF